jgi:hypothetical protein
MKKLCPNVSHVSGENETRGRVNIHFAVRGIVAMQGLPRFWFSGLEQSTDDDGFHDQATFLPTYDPSLIKAM